MRTGSASVGGISDNRGDSRYPSLAIAPNGTPYVAWFDGGGNTGIYMWPWGGPGQETAYLPIIMKCYCDWKVEGVTGEEGKVTFEGLPVNSVDMLFIEVNP